MDLNQVLIETSLGVGYEVLIPFPVHWELKKQTPQSEVFLFIYHSITDRTQRLFGFLTKQDKELFQVMKGLNGIGELTALKILSFYNAKALHRITKDEDRTALEKIPKVRGKTSEKILFELKQNIKKLESFLVEQESPSPKEGLPDETDWANPQGMEQLDQEEDRELDAKDNLKNLAILGLVQLGFDEKTSTKEVDKAWKNGLTEPSEIIGNILKNL